MRLIFFQSSSSPFLSSTFLRCPLVTFSIIRPTRRATADASSTRPLRMRLSLPFPRVNCRTSSGTDGCLAWLPYSQIILSLNFLSPVTTVLLCNLTVHESVRTKRQNNIIIIYVECDHRLSQLVCNDDLLHIIK